MTRRHSPLSLVQAICCVLFFSFFLPLKAERKSILLNENWSFRFSHDVSEKKGRRVDLPHTWNTTDALIGKLDYKRGIGNYTKKVFVPQSWQGKRIFIRFEGANQIANLFLNGKHVGEHRGGYGAFLFELTDRLKYGADNTLWVRVNNAEQLDIMPLVGDFNFYGGIYRDVHLLITDPLCISPLDYASPGVYLTQTKVTHERADVMVRTLLSNSSPQEGKCEIRVDVWDGSRKVLSQSQSHTLKTGEQSVNIPISLQKPHLWNGTKDPFLYRTVVTLSLNDTQIDQVEQPLGLRFFSIDSNNGFLLNGEPVQLRGVCRHQDRADLGNALRKEHHDQDTELMREMGVNAVRLAHYPQATYMYDCMDRNGMLIWAEIPFIGPGGYSDKGFVDQTSFKENGKQQLIELIRQHYNHPSIICWGLFNELKETGDNPVEYIKELNELAHREDPFRPTTSASNQSGAINFVTDLIAWNMYYGWYGGRPADLGTWLDKMHKERPNLRIGISEYGAGASIFHQQDTLAKPAPVSWWHPENWQTYYHIENWKVFAERPFVWGTFVWNMFDFGAAHRTEGEAYGKNDKGLVTFDRTTRKDAFYFYKANWNKENPTLYIAEKRTVKRQRPTTSIAVFTNQKEVELWVNGRSKGKKTPDTYAMIVWEQVTLQPGINTIEVKAKEGKQILTDQCQWTLETSN